MDARHSPLQATIVKPEQAPRIKPFGLDMKVLLITEATGGAISVIMGCHKPGEGSPDHVHFNQEEVFFILEGTYELTVGDQTSTAGLAIRNWSLTSLQQRPFKTGTSAGTHRRSFSTGTGADGALRQSSTLFKTAKLLGLSIPQSVLIRADDIIQRLATRRLSARH